MRVIEFNQEEFDCLMIALGVAAGALSKQAELEPVCYQSVKMFLLLAHKCANESRLAVPE